MQIPIHRLYFGIFSHNIRLSILYFDVLFHLTSADHTPLRFYSLLLDNLTKQRYNIPNLGGVTIHMKTKRITMQDIADRLNISKNAVSLALNGKPELVTA